MTRSVILGVILAALSYPVNVLVRLFGWTVVAGVASPEYADRHLGAADLVGFLFHLVGYSLIGVVCWLAVRKRSARARNLVLIASGLIYSTLVVVFKLTAGWVST
jgi:hypothetical protein